jgi:putative peptidoglycan lipid II flippase
VQDPRSVRTVTSESHLPRLRFAQYLLVAGGLGLAMVLGLVVQALLAYYFGAGPETDALFMARDITEVLAKLLLPSQTVGVLLPMFLAMRTERGREAWTELSAVMTAVLVAATPLVLAAVIFSPALVALFAPGFSDATAEETEQLLRYLAPTMWFSLGGGLAVAILQARDRFGRSMVAAVAGQATVVAALPPLVSSNGVAGASIALLIGAAAQFALAWGLVVMEGMPALANPLRHPDLIRRFARRTTPFFAYAGASQGSAIVYRVSASTLGTGVFAALSFADRIYRALYALIFFPIQTVLFPALARHEAEGRPDDLRVELRAGLRYVLFAVTPLVAEVALLSQEAVSMLFERGEFGGAATDDTALALAIFALALLPTGMYMLLEQASYARARTRLVIGTNVMIAAIQAALFYPLARALGLAGIPVAVLLATTVALFVYLERLYPGASRRAAREQAGFALRVAGCTGGMLVVTLAARGTIEWLVDPPPGLQQAFVVVPAVFLGALVYVALSVAAGLSEPRRIAELGRERLRSAR